MGTAPAGALFSPMFVFRASLEKETDREAVCVAEIAETSAATPASNYDRTMIDRLA